METEAALMGIEGEDGRIDIVASVCGQVAHLPSGDRATLRHLFLGRSEIAVGIVTGLLIRAGAPAFELRDAPAFERWTLLAHAAAVITGTTSSPAHRKSESLGRGLHRAGYSEHRLMRLTSARRSALIDQIKRAARVLAAGGAAPTNLRTLHRLSFDAGPIAEDARLRIARDYFATEHANTKEAS